MSERPIEADVEALAEVLAAHRMRELRGDREIGPYRKFVLCAGCDWPQDVGMSGWSSWVAAHARHVAEQIIDAGFGHVREVEAERDAYMREAYIQGNRLALPACICEEGPYFGAQLAGTPLRCEKCGRDETQNPDRRAKKAEAALADLRAAVEALADETDALAKTLTPCTGPNCAGCRLGAKAARLRALLAQQHDGEAS